MAWTDKYVSVAGGGAHDGSSEANAWTLAEALAAYAGGQRVNVKAGTYTAASRNWNLAGTSSSGSWWRGYNATIGDIDSNNALAKPAIQCGTNGQTFSGAHHLVSNLDFSGNPAGTLLLVSGAHVHFDRCRAENTDSGSTSYTIRATANGFYAGRCSFRGHAACNNVAILEERGAFGYCAFRGGKTGLMLALDGTFAACLYCVFDDQADNYGIDVVNVTTGGSYLIVGNTFYGAGSHGIRVSATQPAFGMVRGNILANSGAYGMATASGTVRLVRVANDFYSNSSGQESGFGDWPSLAEQVESSSPFVNAAGHDFTPALAALARNNAAGGGFENESYRSYSDIGAVRHADPSGGGAVFLIDGGPVR